MSLTQDLESQKDQDITKLLYFTGAQERRRDGVFVCLGIEERDGLYNNGGENINRKSFNES